MSKQPEFPILRLKGVKSKCLSLLIRYKGVFRKPGTSMGVKKNNLSDTAEVLFYTTFGPKKAPLCVLTVSRLQKSRSRRTE